MHDMLPTLMNLYKFDDKVEHKQKVILMSK